MVNFNDDCEFDGKDCCPNPIGIGNGHCNLENNIKMCNFDGGDCCSIETLKDGICDTNNMNRMCKFDGEDCKCDFKNLKRDGYCNQANNKSFCLFDLADCLACKKSYLIDNDICSMENFNQECIFDGEDCTGCVMWRQTGSCDPDGPREPANDKLCNVTIDAGWSGYCECKFGSVMQKGCASSNHSTCAEACAVAYNEKTHSPSPTIQSLCSDYASIENSICDHANVNLVCYFDGVELDCSLGGNTTICTSFECIENQAFEPCPKYALIGNGQCDKENFNLICSYDAADCNDG